LVIVKLFVAELADALWALSPPNACRVVFGILGADDGAGQRPP
jgi:hypothetical protein